MTLKSLTEGDSVCLRKDVLPHVKVREWFFMGKNEGRVILVSYKPNGSHTLEVGKEDEIDGGNIPFKMGGETIPSGSGLIPPILLQQKLKKQTPEL